MATVHVLYNGKTEDLSFEQLFPEERRLATGITREGEVTGANLTEAQVKSALSQYYDVGQAEFQDHFVEINPNGNVTVRPNTTFGS